MKQILLIALLFVASGSAAQSVSILSNGKYLITETVINKDYDHANMGISVLAGDKVTLGYRVGTNLNFKSFSPNVYLTNTIEPKSNGAIYLAPSLSMGYKVKKVKLFIEYKYLFDMAVMNGGNFFGIGIKL